ncbi:LCP family protein [Pseudactinotalea sp. Z1748]|uniref:LCP family protein n=1 Tax=Pseudactinotalea sp. Z1748 TaxID=3413027 RepID=UPI003C7E4EDE
MSQPPRPSRRPRLNPRHAAPRRRLGRARPAPRGPAAAAVFAAATNASPTTPGSIRHAAARQQRRHVALVAVLALGMFVTSGVAWAYRDLDSNIQTHDIDDLLGDERPEPVEAPDPEDPHAGQALNVLLVGTDDRSGENFEIGGGTTPGVRSDTVIVAHISADRDRVEMISIPRDSWVTVPSCEMPDGSATNPREGKFNAAFEIGGQTGDVGYAAACTIRTVEALTNVRIDGFIAVDFAGFVNVVDALGGVPFCVPEPISDRQAHIELEAGEQVLDGEQALGYARVRKSLGDGSDIQRIDRQQDLLAATARHVLDQNLLTDAGKLYAFLDAATSSVTASRDFGSISALSGLAYALRHIDPGEITFATVPVVGRGDGANVVWTDEAIELWEAVAADQPLHVTEEQEEDLVGAEADDGATGAEGTDVDGADADTDSASPDDGSTGPTLDGSTAEQQNGPCG